jgi:hypothetical protein
MQKKFGQKQIPTLLGLAILVLSLIGGIWFIGEGAGVFAPRAAPQTTPKKVKITNVKENGFSISFATDEATAGFVKYGIDQNSLKSQASDDRDQVTGSVGQYTNHQITLRDLKPDTTYYYTLGTGSTPKYDNNGSPFITKTPKRLGAAAAAKTIYGTVTTADGTGVSGALVYASIPGVGALSSLTKDSGSWAIPLSTARTTDGSQYANVSANDAIQLTAQGIHGGEGAFASVTVGTAQPAAPLLISATGGSTPTSTEADATGTTANVGTAETPSETTPSDASASDQIQAQTQQEQVATQEPIDTTTNSTQQAQGDGNGLQALVQQNQQSQPTTDQASSVPATDGKTVNLKEDTNQIVQTTQPVITGQAAPKVMLQIEIHSDTQITTQVTTDTTGQYSIDLSSLQQQLEPGTHTITISYLDPKTNKTVTETRTFVVGEQASLASTSQPFGSGNPFTLETPSPSPSPTASESAEPRVSIPSSPSSKPVSGTTDTTFALILGGAFFVIAGAWSYLHNGKLERIKF